MDLYLYGLMYFVIFCDPQNVGLKQRLFQQCKKVLFLGARPLPPPPPLSGQATKKKRTFLRLFMQINKHIHIMRAIKI